MERWNLIKILSAAGCCLVIAGIIFGGIKFAGRTAWSKVRQPETVETAGTAVSTVFKREEELNFDNAMEKMFAPCGILTEDNGEVLVTDLYNKVIWRVKEGKSSIFAGKIGQRDLSGEPVGGYLDGSPDQAVFQEPWAIAPFLNGYAVSDAANHAIRFIDGDSVRTAAGTGEPGYSDGRGTKARFNRPTGLCADGKGNLYIADTGNGMIRRMDTVGNVTTLAQGLSEPTGLCFDGGVLYVADSGNHRIVTVEGEGKVNVFAGSGAYGMEDGSLKEASFSSPQGIAVGMDGAVYVSDTGNAAVRKLENGQVTTLIVGDAEKMQLYPVAPAGLLPTQDRLYVCDYFSRCVFGIELENGSIPVEKVIRDMMRSVSGN